MIENKDLLVLFRKIKNYIQFLDRFDSFF